MEAYRDRVGSVGRPRDRVGSVVHKWRPIGIEWVQWCTGGGSGFSGAGAWRE